ncbi:MAG: four helix bundle protein [Kiritimatiellae bacterium]|nr:four helix bundle protein [Kiritimatiellia bacterium]
MAEFKHRRLEVWQIARAMVKSIYGISSQFPSSEAFGLTDQIRRAAVSVPSNIAEGSSRQTKADFIHFLVMARGSLAEVDTQLVLAEDLGYVVEKPDLHSCLEDLSIRLNHLIAHIRGGSRHGG